MERQCRCCKKKLGNEEEFYIQHISNEGTYFCCEKCYPSACKQKGSPQCPMDGKAFLFNPSKLLG